MKYLKNILHARKSTQMDVLKCGSSCVLSKAMQKHHIFQLVVIKFCKFCFLLLEESFLVRSMHLEAVDTPQPLKHVRFPLRGVQVEFSCAVAL